MGGLKSISTFVDVCGEGMNRLRDLRQKSSHSIKEGGFEGMGEALLPNRSKRLASFVCRLQMVFHRSNLDLDS